MTKRIFRSIFLTSLAAIILVSAFIIFTLYSAYENSARAELKTATNQSANKLRYAGDKTEYFKRSYFDHRVTLIAADGRVLYDSNADAAAMENHSDRPEVILAARDGYGESYRYSNTLSEKTLYYAVRLADGDVLRVSKTQDSILGLLWSMVSLFFLIITGVAVLSVIAARLLTRRIVAPINAIDLDDSFGSDTYDELSPLLLRIERQHKEIENKISEITEKQREFAAVTENMREGMILVSGEGDILSINKSALAIFGANSGVSTGSHILSVNRSVELQSVFEAAVNGSYKEELLSINSRHYKILGNPVMSKAAKPGAVILILDVTYKHSAEHSRREFTANVSHELKTPLTSISGFAEIMKNGTAKPEDMPGFAARILNEANRLIVLIDDILNLSQLDEMAKLPDKEPVDLAALAEDVVSRLKPVADKQRVSITLIGERVTVYGYKKVLDAMLFNLCDNAIKYNIACGNVSVDIKYVGGRPSVTVKDTGIGIPAEHQPHVFERFYRVDKSRSKETGGTGLGLSIVKHGAMLHDALIDLKSTENAGTTVELTFPRVNHKD